MQAWCSTFLWLQRCWLFVVAVGTVLGVAAVGVELPPFSLLGALLLALCGGAWCWSWGSRFSLGLLLFSVAFSGALALASRQQHQLGLDQLKDGQGQYVVLRGHWQNHPHPRKEAFSPSHRGTALPLAQSTMQAVLLVDSWLLNVSGDRWQRLPTEARVWVSWRGNEGPLLGAWVEVIGKLRPADRSSPFGI